MVSDMSMQSSNAYALLGSWQRYSVAPESSFVKLHAYGWVRWMARNWGELRLTGLMTGQSFRSWQRFSVARECLLDDPTGRCKTPCILMNFMGTARNWTDAVDDV